MPFLPSGYGLVDRRGGGCITGAGFHLIHGANAMPPMKEGLVELAYLRDSLNTGCMCLLCDIGRLQGYRHLSRAIDSTPRLLQGCRGAWTDIIHTYYN